MTRDPSKRIVRLPVLIAGCYWVALIGGSLLPLRYKQILRVRLPEALGMSRLDSDPGHIVSHCFFFAVGGVLFLALFGKKAGGATAITILLIAAILIEVVQHLAYANVMEWKDIVYDTLGILAGWLLFRIYNRALSVIRSE